MTDRLAVWYPIEEADAFGPGRQFWTELYPHMLIDDIGLTVMPLGKRWTKKEFAVELEPPSERFEELLAGALDPEDHGRDLTDAACEFLRRAAQVATGYGRAVYEVVIARDAARDVRRVQFFDVVGRLKVSKTHITQLVPSAIAEERGVESQIRLPRRKALIFEPPLTKRRMRAMMEALSDVGRPEIAEFVFASMRGEGNLGYDSAQDVRVKKLAVAEVTREIGWDARGTFREHTLEYYEIARRLTFERFLARFRASMLAEINRAVGELALAIGERGQLRLTGLPNEDDVDVAEAQLGAGTTEFKSVLAPFRDL